MNSHSSRPFVTLVSGLPRSGTSMMMKMLEAGGIPPITDNLRTADVDNPQGYYEFEPIKAVKQDSSWMPKAVGKSVKAIYRLLYDLPPGFEYRVVFMRRNLDEVLASQTEMLKRRGEQSKIEDAKMRALFTSELARVDKWLQQNPQFRVHNVSYNEILAAPEPHVTAINTFLGGDLDQQAMLEVVNPTLYRNRK